MKVLYDVKDASWKPDASAVCNIVVSTNHVVSVVFDSAHKRFVSLYCAEMALETDKPALIEEVLSTPNPEVAKRNYFISVQKTMLVPNALYERENRDVFLEKQHRAEVGETASDYPVKIIDATMAYLYAESLAYPKSAIPIDAAWLDGLALGHKTNDGIHFHFNIHDGFISIAVFKKGSLQFYNTFDTANAEEVLYYVMFVSEQLQVNPHKDSYYYSGFMKKGDGLYALILKYIKALKPEERPAMYSYAMPVLDVPGHIFFNAFCTPICES